MLKLSIDLTKMLVRRFNKSSITNGLTLDVNICSEISNIESLPLRNLPKPSLKIKKTFNSLFVPNRQTILKVKCKTATMTFHTREIKGIEKKNMVPGFVQITKLKDLYDVSLYQNKPVGKNPILTCSDQITKSMKLLEITPLILCWTIEKLNDNETETKSLCRFLEFKSKQDASDFKSEFEQAVQRSLITPQSIIKKRLFTNFEKSDKTACKNIFNIVLDHNSNNSPIYYNRKFHINLDKDDNDSYNN
jgi:hypothetical protein